MLLKLPDDVMIKICQITDMPTIKKLRLLCTALRRVGDACISKLVSPEHCGTTTKQFEAFLQSLRGLTSLRLSIQTTDQLPMLDAKGVMSVLTGLDINAAVLDRKQRKAIASNVGRASKLLSLCFSSNKAALSIPLGPTLSVCSGLRRLTLLDADVGAQEAKALLTATHLTALNVGFAPSSPWDLPSNYWTPNFREFWEALGTELSQFTTLVELGTVQYATGLFYPSQLTGLQALRCVVWWDVEVVVDALLAMTRICDLEFCHRKHIASSLYERLFEFCTGLTRLLLDTPKGTHFDLNLLPTGLQHLQIHVSRAISQYPNIKSLQHLDVWSELCNCNFMRCIGPLTGLTHLGIAHRSGCRVSTCQDCRGPARPDLSCLLDMSQLRSLKLESQVLWRHERNLGHLQDLPGLTKLELHNYSEVYCRNEKLDSRKLQLLELLPGIEEVVLDRIPNDFEPLLNGERLKLGHNPVRVVRSKFA
eukprot:jgi/Botrbrau1/11333/Bobra.0038s0092.1